MEGGGEGRGSVVDGVVVDMFVVDGDMTSDKLECVVWSQRNRARVC